MPLPKNRLFPVALEDAHRLPENHPPLHSIRARTTGEFRRVKAGEWYISGAIPEAYYQPHDAWSGAADIAELVEVRVTTQYNVVGLVPIE